jgi:hypothetical protein
MDDAALSRSPALRKVITAYPCHGASSAANEENERPLMECASSMRKNFRPTPAASAGSDNSQ